MTVITRFPPSPTGYLHIGGARTALYSWLYARQHQGQFILRIEDTDLERSNSASVDAILEGMQWLKLDYDHGPYYQTHRLDRYREVAHQLVQSGHAYCCMCSKERLEALRVEQQAKQLHTGYDGHCRDLHITPSTHPQKEQVIRLKVPKTGVTTWEDLIKGEITVANAELDDFVLVRSDGIPTYNFAVVVDDADMGVTHVIRGDDHVSNTPKQIHMFQALEAVLPAFGHIPMILGEDGKRLSKRHGAVSVMQYARDGYLPEALLNYLVRLGWSHQDQEIFSREEMIQSFNFKAVSKSPAMFNLDKLKWLNQHYMKAMPAPEMLEKLRALADTQPIIFSPIQNQAIWLEAIPLYTERCHTLLELLDALQFLDFSSQKLTASYDPIASEKHLTEAAIAPLQALITALQEIPWSVEAIHTCMQATATQLNLGMGKVGMPFRVALTGQGQSPSIDRIAMLLGRESVLERLQGAILWISQGAVCTGEVGI